MMDQNLTLQTLKDRVQYFCEARDWDQFHSIKDLAIGLSTESAELLEIFRFHSEADCTKLLQSEADRKRIADELIDSLFFILRMSQKYGFDLGTAFEDKMRRNAERYPVSEYRGSNKKA